MDSSQSALIAGILSSLLFMSSNVPMVMKMFKTRDMRSYSLSNLMLANVGNLVYWFYIASLPTGPIWVLHGFYTLTAAVMLFCYLHLNPMCGITGKIVRFLHIAPKLAEAHPVTQMVTTVLQPESFKTGIRNMQLMPAINECES